MPSTEALLILTVFLLAMLVIHYRTKLAMLTSVERFREEMKETERLLVSEFEPSEYEVRVARMLPLAVFNALFAASYTSLSELDGEKELRLCRTMKYLEPELLALALMEEPAETREIFFRAMSERAADMIREDMTKFEGNILSAEEADSRQEEHEASIREHCERSLTDTSL